MGHWSGSSQNTRKGTTTTQVTYAYIPSLSHYTSAMDKKSCGDSDVGTLVFVRESHLFLDISFTRVSIDEQESKVIEQYFNGKHQRAGSKIEERGFRVWV